VVRDGEEEIVQWELQTLKLATTVGQEEGRVINKPF
jgi:hypothetical protein